MATSIEEREFILDRIGMDEKILCRPMMGEYLLYYLDQLFGGIYNGKLLVKKTNNGKKFNLEEVIPYRGAKSMYWVADLDDVDLVEEIIISTAMELKRSKN